LDISFYIVLQQETGLTSLNTEALEELGINVTKV